MSSAEIRRLEQEVEEARSRVLGDIDRLRAPGNVAELKREVSRTKDQWVDAAKEAATDQVDGALSAIKDRALANPLAVLAIGAGIGWRLKNHPPIATALVGLGLLGLMRADPRRPSESARAAARARRAAEAAAERVAAYAASAREGAQEQAARAGERVGGLAGEARERLSAAGETVGEWGEAASEAAGEAMSRAVHGAERLGETGREAYTAFRESEDRDKYLLGAAALAIAAAVGIASQRRSG